MSKLANEARQHIAALGWSQAELARRTGHHANTVTNWFSTGQVPKIVMEFLRLKVKLKELAD